MHNFLAAMRQRSDNALELKQEIAKKSQGADMPGTDLPTMDVSDVWETKDGRRRVRRDPPTVEEAVVAAQGLTDDLKEQAEIVASLMEVTVDEARGVVLRMGQRKEVNLVTMTGRAGAPRAVIVERRTSRFAAVPRRSAGR
jgi:hypothetical protein